MFAVSQRYCNFFALLFFRVRKRLMENGRICCVQFSQSDGRTPLIPPSHNIQAGIYWKDAEGNNERSLVALRSEYRRWYADSKKRRKYLEGALIRELPGTGYYTIDPRDGDVVLDMEIMREKFGGLLVGRRNFYCCTIGETEILDGALRFATSMAKSGAVRDDDGSEGRMLAAGVRYPSHAMGTKDYEFVSCVLGKRETELSEEKVLRRELLSGPLGKRLSLCLNEKMPEVMASIRVAEQKRKVARPDYMKDCPAATCIVSRNLVNAMHTDLDHSMSVVFWVGDEQDSCYFVLPNVSLGVYQGVVVRVRPGTLIGWDGRTVLHCTACSGYQGDCYGIFFASVNGGFGKRNN